MTDFDGRSCFRYKHVDWMAPTTFAYDDPDKPGWALIEDCYGDMVLVPFAALAAFMDHVRAHPDPRPSALADMVARQPEET